MELEASAGLAKAKPPYYTVPLSTTTVTGSADGDSRSDADHSLS